MKQLLHRFLQPSGPLNSEIDKLWTYFRQQSRPDLSTIHTQAAAVRELAWTNPKEYIKLLDYVSTLRVVQYPYKEEALNVIRHELSKPCSKYPNSLY
ncbi:hypothetical protein GEMRC1_003981 [Eukaryota sp. GEM-RC1]